MTRSRRSVSWLVRMFAASLLTGCTHSARRNTPDIGSWDTCVFERMSMRDYEKQYAEVLQLAETFHTTLQRIKKEPEFLDRAISYWDKLAGALRLSPDEFSFEAQWTAFRECTEIPGAEVFRYSAKRGDCYEEGMVVVKDGELLQKHRIASGTKHVSE